MGLPVADPLPLPSAEAQLGDRSLFPDLAWRVYANHAAISPYSAPVQSAIVDATRMMGARGLGGFPAMHAQRARLRGRLARLLGGHQDEIGLVLNTSAGITSIALCFPWAPGDRIGLFAGEFPTNITPWQRAAEAFGLELVFLPVEDLARSDGPDWTRLDAALAEGLRLVAVSAVQFQSGLRVPLGALGKRCHDQGTQVCVDAIQALGAAPLNVGELPIDYLACGGHKWLMGPEGAGLVWARAERAAELRPLTASWLSHESAVDFLFEPGALRYDKPIRRQIDFVEGGAPNAIGYAGLEVAVELILQLGVGAIFEHIQRWHDALEPALVARGFTSLRAPDLARRSGVLSAVPPDGLTAVALVEALGRRGIACTTPEGLIRFAPHWPSSLSEPSLIADALDEVLAELQQGKP